MRSWIAGHGLSAGIPLGEVMRGGGIARVLESRAEDFAAGDLVQARLGWQTHPTIAGTLPAETRSHARHARGLDRAARLERGHRLFRTARYRRRCDRATGCWSPPPPAAWGKSPCRSRASKAAGWSGIAGGAEKCAFVAGELGADAAIDYKAETNLSAAIARACPDGIDLYFDNVGGPTLDAALEHLREGARVVLCGRISQTLAAEPHAIRNLGACAAAHGRMQGFLVFNYHERYDEARAWLAARRRDGSLRQRLHVLEGLARRRSASACCSAARIRASWWCRSPIAGIVSSDTAARSSWR